MSPSLGEPSPTLDAARKMLEQAGYSVSWTPEAEIPFEPKTPALSVKIGPAVALLHDGVHVLRVVCPLNFPRPQLDAVFMKATAEQRKEAWLLFRGVLLRDPHLGFLTLPTGVTGFDKLESVVLTSVLMYGEADLSTHNRLIDALQGMATMVVAIQTFFGTLSSPPSAPGNQKSVYAPTSPPDSTGVA